MSHFGGPHEAMIAQISEPPAFNGANLPEQDDRRESPRIPLVSPVKIGPPSGAPYALVSAQDISAGGLFIDADRPVRVGAKFSAEILLAGGTSVYIPEAEVTYNRERNHGSGFGVRFVVADAQAIEAIHEEVLRVTGKTLIAQVGSIQERLSQLPTIPPDSTSPELATALGAEFSSYPAPELADHQSLESVLPSNMPIPGDADLSSEIPEMRRTALLPSEFEPDVSGLSVPPGPFDGVREFASDLRHAVIRRSQGGQGVWKAIMIAGGLALAVGAALSLAGPSEKVVAEPVATADRGVQPSTHGVLMGETQVDALGSDPERVVETAPKPKKRALPPLVVVDPPKQKTPEPRVKDVEKKDAAKKVAAKKVAKPTKVKKRTPDKVKAPAPKPAPAVVVKKKTISSTARKILGDTEQIVTLSFGLAPGARVLKTHVFHKPERFVIDVVDQPKLPSTPDVQGPVESIRVGRHPNFTRIVIDAGQVLEAGRVDKKSDRLKVELHYQ